MTAMNPPSRADLMLEEVASASGNGSSPSLMFSVSRLWRACQREAFAGDLDDGC